MSAPTREEWLTVTREITTNVQRMIGLLLDAPPEASPAAGKPEDKAVTADIERRKAAKRRSEDDAVTAYELGFDAGLRAGFPRPPACPDWCDEKHGPDPSQWESIDRKGVEVVRCHARHVGDVAGKVGVEIVADSLAGRGEQPVTSEPVLSLDTSGDGEMLGTEARQLARLLTEAADELEFNILGGGQ